MTPRARPAATVPLDCGSTAIVAASPMAAAARTVSGFRRDLAPATPTAFRNTRIISRSLAPSGMWVIVDRDSFPAPKTPSALVLVPSTQFPVREPSFLSVQPCTAQITPHQKKSSLQPPRLLFRPAYRSFWPGGDAKTARPGATGRGGFQILFSIALSLVTGSELGCCPVPRPSSLDLPRFRGEVRSWDQGSWFDCIVSSSLGQSFGSAESIFSSRPARCQGRCVERPHHPRLQWTTCDCKLVDVGEHHQFAKSEGA
jgi:hypothetical protein